MAVPVAINTPGASTADADRRDRPIAGSPRRQAQRMLYGRSTPVRLPPVPARGAHHEVREALSRGCD
jgi:hypothetical protein